MRISDWSSDVCSSDLAAELIGFCRRKPGTDDRHLHCLLLKQRNAQGLFEHGTQLGLGIFGLLLAFAATEIGMDLVSLHRSGTARSAHLRFGIFCVSSCISLFSPYL